MPIVKANEPLGPRSLIIAWYGDPGIGKTSLFNSCKNPLLIDGDRGVSRSVLRKDTLVIENWDEVLKHEKDGDFKGYATVGIDTPKAILDDFLMSYVVNKDPKLRVNKLGAYGAIGDEFKLFLNNRRQEKADIAIICHSRKDDDSKRMIPDVTGQSLNLILRIADMIGYYTIINGRRMLSFEPTESTFGKNVARIPPVEVPDSADPAFRTFMADIFERVRTAIASHSEEQLKATEKSALYQETIQAAQSLQELDGILAEIADLPDYLRMPLIKVIDTKKMDSYKEAIAACDSPDLLTQLLEEVTLFGDAIRKPLKVLIQEKGREKGYIANVNTKRFESTDDTADNHTILATSYDERCQVIGGLGMAAEIDRFTGFGLAYSFEDIGTWTEAQYLDHVAAINEAKKAPKRPAGRRQGAVTR